KNSPGKATLPGLKQVWRQQGKGGQYLRDHLSLGAETLPGQPMLAQVMAAGKIITPQPTLDDIRQRLKDQLRRLPQPFRALDPRAAYDVRLSKALRRLAAATHPLANPSR
ncbi:MAG TPA: nicotinate phosphoribosyltransferase, partial [Candidatus Brocadiia bacterium]|nr:nicotinate phosphoribosyltransferase [Candidatus Brocadiia bacterium]